MREILTVLINAYQWEHLIYGIVFGIPTIDNWNSSELQTLTSFGFFCKSDLFAGDKTESGPNCELISKSAWIENETFLIVFPFGQLFYDWILIINISSWRRHSAINEYDLFILQF